MSLVQGLDCPSSSCSRLYNPAILITPPLLGLLAAVPGSPLFPPLPFRLSSRAQSPVHFRLPDITASACALAHTCNKLSSPLYLGAVMFSSFLASFFHSSGPETQDQSCPFLFNFSLFFSSLISISCLSIFQLKQ